jgi:AraC-like DNA-binding protein
MSLEPSQDDLLQAAASKTFDRIELDREQAPEKLKPMLAHIASHLFDPKLNVNRLKKACGIRDNSVAIHFHSAVGQPPHAYISQCRLETAARLLRDTDLPVWKISEMLGFSSIQVFSRAFHRWCGQRPTTYRKENRTTRSPESDTGKGRKDALADPETWRRALAGQLRSDEAAGLVYRLLELYPPSRR